MQFFIANKEIHFSWFVFSGNHHFDKDSSQKYLIFQAMYKSLQLNWNILFIHSPDIANFNDTKLFSKCKNIVFLAKKKKLFIWDTEKYI